MSEYQDEVIGANESEFGNGIFLNLRCGQLAQTSNDPVEGYIRKEWEKKDGTKGFYYAHPYKDICGYITNLKWFERTFKDGGKRRGWLITVQVGDQTFIIDLASTDQPYHRVMASLLNVNFERPVRIAAFPSKGKNGKVRKTMLFFQGAKHPEGHENAGKPKSVDPLYREKWLSLELIRKIKEGKELDDQDKANLSFLPDGKINRDYPYIKQNADGTWDFSKLTNFLIEKMNNEVIPNIQDANAKREPVRANAASAGSNSGDDFPEYSGSEADEAPMGPDDDYEF